VSPRGSLGPADGEQATSSASGFVKVPYALLDDSRLSSAARLVWIALARHADYENHTAYPSLQRLADLSGLGLTSVKAAIRLLEATGWIRHTRRGKGMSNYYRVVMDAGRLSPPQVMDATRPSLAECRSPDDRVMVATRPSDGRQATTNENHLTRTTEQEITTKGQADGAYAPAVPTELTGFDAILRGVPGYRPTAEFYAKVAASYAPSVDIEQMAIRLADWYTGLPGETRPVNIVSLALKFLKNALENSNDGHSREHDDHRGPVEAASRRRRAATGPKKPNPFAAYD